MATPIGLFCMPVDALLAARIRQPVGRDPTISERKVLGGLCVTATGSMCFGVVGDDLMVRVGPER